MCCDVMPHLFVFGSLSEVTALQRRKEKKSKERNSFRPWCDIIPSWWSVFRHSQLGSQSPLKGYDRTLRYRTGLLWKKREGHGKNKRTKTMTTKMTMIANINFVAKLAVLFLSTIVASSGSRVVSSPSSPSSFMDIVVAHREVKEEELTIPIIRNATCSETKPTFYYYEECLNSTHIVYYTGNCTTAGVASAAVVKEEVLGVLPCTDYGSDLTYCTNACGGVVCTSSRLDDVTTSSSATARQGDSTAIDVCDDASFTENHTCPVTATTNTTQQHHFEVTKYTCTPDKSGVEVFTQECENSTYSNETLVVPCQDVGMNHCIVCGEVSVCSMDSVESCDMLGVDGDDDDDDDDDGGGVSSNDMTDNTGVNTTDEGEEGKSSAGSDHGHYHCSSHLGVQLFALAILSLSTL